MNTEGGQNGEDVHSNFNEKNVQIDMNYEGEGEPKDYIIAIRVKVRSEFIIYFDNERRTIAYQACNEEAKKIQDHTNLIGFSDFDTVKDVFMVSIDDFEIDTESEDMSVTLVDSRIPKAEVEGIFEVLRSAVDEAFKERDKKGVVDIGVPKDYVYKEVTPDEEPVFEEPLSLEDHPNYNSDTSSFICGSQKDIDDVIEYAQKVDPNLWDIAITFNKDISINMNSKYAGMSFDLSGHNITIVGNAGYNQNKSMPIRISNAGSVDLSGLNIDLESAENIPPNVHPRDERESENYAYYNSDRGNFQIFEINDTNGANIALPEGIDIISDNLEDKKADPRLFSIFEPYAVLNKRDGLAILEVFGPADTYESRKEKEEQVLKSIFENGEYRSLTEQTSNNSYFICTDITMDIGDCTLPNRDYETLCVGKGGSVKLTGTLYITGGTFNIETNEYDGIDLRDLTIVKKHPSPDMIKIDYDPSVGIDSEMVKCKTASGTIYYSDGGGKISITVW